MQRLRRFGKAALFMENVRLTLASWPQEANNFSIVAFVACTCAKNAQVVDNNTQKMRVDSGGRK